MAIIISCISCNFFIRSQIGTFKIMRIALFIIILSLILSEGLSKMPKQTIDLYTNFMGVASLM